LLPVGIRIEKRTEVPSWVRISVPLGSLGVAFLALTGIIASLGLSPGQAYAIMIGGSLKPPGLNFMAIKFIPLLLCALGLVLAFRANVMNIGAEGQLLMGAMAATGLALYVMPGAPSFLLVPCMFLVGFLAGAAWAFLPGLLKAKLNVNEVVSTLMMNYIAIYIVDYLVYGPWRGPQNRPPTREIPPQAQLPVFPGTSIHYPTLLLALISAFLVYVLMMRTKLGYEIRVVGSNPEAARYAGISTAKVMVITMMLSGGFAGLAGVGEVAGNLHRLHEAKATSAGLGYTAIIVAWLSRLSPLGTILSALFMGFMLTCTLFSLRFLGPEITYGLTNVFNGLILVCMITGEVFLRYRIRFVWGRGRT